jgi:hypothetical protein
LRLEDEPPLAGQLISPLDASPTQHWIVDRGISIEDARSCPIPAGASAGLACEDPFTVDAVTAEPAP